MAYTDIDDPSAYFQTALYNGNAGTQTITNDGNSDLQPDMVWMKCRSGTHATENHRLQDSLRGVGKFAIPNGTTAADTANTSSLTAFNSNGFSLGNVTDVNGDGAYVAWQWKETADAGFDIVTYTGSGSAKTVAHNLGVKPDVIICKSRSGTEEWRPYFSALGATYGMRLNGTNVRDDDAGYWNDVEPTSSVFTVGTNAGTNGNNVTFIAYCFAEKKGYSKFSSYIGNGNANGPFVYTGFKPSWVMIKRAIGDGGEGWSIFDTARSPFNKMVNELRADVASAESTSNHTMEFYSNGFKIPRAGGGLNTSGDTHIYMAFAEQPFVTSTGVPATAR